VGWEQQGPWEANMHAKHFLEHLANSTPLVLAPHVEQVLAIVHESWQYKPYPSLDLLAALGIPHHSTHSVRRHQSLTAHAHAAHAAHAAHTN
jgi:hypothetical protein